MSFGRPISSKEENLKAWLANAVTEVNSTNSLKLSTPVFW